MTDAPKTIAEMREAAAAAYDSVADPLLNEPCAFKRACFRAGWEAAIRALPADAEMVERVGKAIRDSFGTVSQPKAIDKIARAALAAMRGEP